MASECQIAANRENGKKGGPKTPDGKAVSRMNARKHGIFGSALTEYDAAELHAKHEEFAESLQPVGALEEALVEQLALTYLRMQRCALAEAQWHVAAWAPSKPGPDCEMNDEGKPVDFDFDTFEESVRLLGRYNTTLTNQFLRLTKDIGQLQKTRLQIADRRLRNEREDDGLNNHNTTHGKDEGGRMNDEDGPDHDDTTNGYHHGGRMEEEGTGEQRKDARPPFLDTRPSSLQSCETNPISRNRFRDEDIGSGINRPRRSKRMDYF